MISVAIANQQGSLRPDSRQLRRAVRAVLLDAEIRRADISLALVDDCEIRRLNRKFLAHDYATDVLSFALSDRDGPLEGEIVVSAETAVRVANSLGWPAQSELLLYVIHGVLHLVGYDDAIPAEARVMRQREEYFLQRLGLHPPTGPRAGVALPGPPITRHEKSK